MKKIENKSMETIFDLIKARFTVIWVRSPEEARVLELMKKKVPDLLASRKTLWSWSCTEGFICLSDPSGKKNNKDMTEVDTALSEIIKQIPQTKEDGKIWILKDFHPFLNNPITSRLVRDAAHLLLESRSTIILLSNSGTVPVDLEGDITLVDFDLPTVEEIVEIVRERVKQAQEAGILKDGNYDDARIRRHAEACLGMTTSQIEGAISRSLISKRTIDVTFLLREKEDVVKKAGLLEFQQPDTDMASVGGLDLLKDWLVMRADSFTPEAHNYGLPNPRGVLLAGVPGCGKSLCAKAIGGLLELPILRMDVGRMFAGIVGQSEENMRRAIKLAEAIAPCVLWIDEIEKGLSGLGSSNMTDGGTSARVFGTFIHWIDKSHGLPQSHL